MCKYHYRNGDGLTVSWDFLIHAALFPVSSPRQPPVYSRRPLSMKTPSQTVITERKSRHKHCDSFAWGSPEQKYMYLWGHTAAAAAAAAPAVVPRAGYDSASCSQCHPVPPDLQGVSVCRSTVVMAGVLLTGRDNDKLRQTESNGSRWDQKRSSKRRFRECGSCRGRRRSWFNNWLEFDSWRQPRHTIPLTKKKSCNPEHYALTLVHTMQQTLPQRRAAWTRATNTSLRRQTWKEHTDEDAHGRDTYKWVQHTHTRAHAHRHWTCTIYAHTG